MHNLAFATFSLALGKHVITLWNIFEFMGKRII